MTKKHFVAFAKSIKELNIQNKEHALSCARIVADIAKADNQNFDENRFFKACGF